MQNVLHTEPTDNLELHSSRESQQIIIIFFDLCTFARMRSRILCTTAKIEQWFFVFTKFSMRNVRFVHTRFQRAQSFAFVFDWLILNVTPLQNYDAVKAIAAVHKYYGFCGANVLDLSSVSVSSQFICNGSIWRCMHVLVLVLGRVCAHRTLLGSCS